MLLQEFREDHKWRYQLKAFDPEYLSNLFMVMTYLFGAMVPVFGYFELCSRSQNFLNFNKDAKPPFSIGNEQFSDGIMRPRATLQRPVGAAATTSRSPGTATTLTEEVRPCTWPSSAPAVESSGTNVTVRVHQPLKIVFDAKSNLKRRVGNERCWYRVRVALLNLFLFVSGDMGGDKNLMRHWTGRAKGFGHQNVSEKHIRSVTVDTASKTGLPIAEWRTLSSTTLGAARRTVVKLLVNLCLSEILMQPARCMAVTYHATEEQMRKDYCPKIGTACFHKRPPVHSESRSFPHPTPVSVNC